jgi:hypothetical protein
MTEHYTKNTVSVSVWCKPCARITVHRVFNGRKGPCTECLAKRDVEHDLRNDKPAAAEQLALFAVGGSR